MSAPTIGTVPLRGGTSLSPGTWLGKHQLIHRLAVGGMAEIYLARATGIEQFEKLLVLKRMLPQHADDHRFIRMFLDEARLAATFSHPNVAHVYDIGGGDGNYYFTMEYVHGEDLGAVLAASRAAGRPVPLQHALTIVTGIAAGLHAAHEKRGADGALLGVVHRDVSPSNVLVGYDGSVKVVDFGIARIASQHGPSGNTRAGGFMGKARYTSPEQIQGEPLDRRSDIFSLGIVLFELTTGTRPFDGDGDSAVMQAIASGDAPLPGRLRPDYPAALEQIVVRALRRDRSARFATAQELQLALEELARQQHLSLSSAMLSTYMSELFGGKIAAWHEARRAGRSLTDHVIATITGGTVDLAPDAAPARADHAPAGRPAAPANPVPASRGGSLRRRRKLALGIVLLAAALGITHAVSRATQANPGATGAVAAPRTDSAGAPTRADPPDPVGAPAPTGTPAPAPVASPPPSPQDPARARGIAPPARTREDDGHRGTTKRSRVHRARPTAAGSAQRTPPWDPDSPLEP